MGSWGPRSVGGRHGIVAAGIEWMAAPDATQRQPAAAECTEARDCLHRIARAARMEAAAWSQQGTDEALVAFQQGDEDAFDHGGSGAGTRCRGGVGWGLHHPVGAKADERRLGAMTSAWRAVCRHPRWQS